MPILADPFDKLTADLNATFRPQREWIEKRGLFLVTAHFLSGTGAGAWFFSWLFEIPWGLKAGFLLVALGSVAHLVFLGQPKRFWRMLAHPRTSWFWMRCSLPGSGPWTANPSCSAPAGG